MTEVTNHVPRAWLPRCETQSQSYKSDKKKTQTGTSSFTVRESYGECYIYCFMNAMHRFFFFLSLDIWQYGVAGECTRLGIIMKMAL